MPCPPHLSICNMANERQEADDSIYNDRGGKIDVREFSDAVGNGRQYMALHQVQLVSPPSQSCDVLVILADLCDLCDGTELSS